MAPHTSTEMQDAWDSSTMKAKAPHKQNSLHYRATREDVAQETEINLSRIQAEPGQAIKSAVA